MDNLKIPQHIAIIMDGNGRWAKKRMMPRNYGHMQGSKRVEEICRAAHELGIKYLTIYAFSTENWNRPKDEVDALMKILRNYLAESVKKSTDNNMRVRVLGDRSRLDADIVKHIEELEAVSASNTGLNFQIALNYGSRDEMLRAMKKLAKDCVDGKIKDTEDISEELFEGYLDTAEIPDADLLIRTSGEERLSNFLLWQLAYAEFYFTDVLWPDFDKNELKKAIEAYTKRDRRFGGVKEA
ncbi:MAG: isoprenyl transferase [Lachnospiraceae bacterium]|nr:isoprenyl transferase [Lachnospiraceae bacterium]